MKAKRRTEQPIGKQARRTSPRPVPKKGRTVPETIPELVLDEQLLGLLGFARRARMLFVGFEAVRRAIARRQAALVLVSRDLGKDNSKKIKFIAHSNNVPLYIISDDTDWRGRSGLFGYKILAVKKGPLAEGFKKKL